MGYVKEYKALSIGDMAKRFCKICHICNRKVPNHDFFTKNGCKWCNNKYHSEDKTKIEWRPIKLKTLGIQGIVYRIFVVFVNAIFFMVGAKQSMQQYGAIGTSLIWGSINMTLYYLYHYVFLRLFKIGASK